MVDGQALCRVMHPSDHDVTDGGNGGGERLERGRIRRVIQPYSLAFKGDNKPVQFMTPSTYKSNVFNSGNSITRQQGIRC